jgi:peptidoglycan hydrolase-like protein with peptidoglycan-binding domain
MRNLQRFGLALLAGATVVTTALATGGAAGAATAAPTAATAVAVKTATLTWPVVALGAKGERVIAIQYLLNQQIGAHLAIDGVFGKNTEAAVKAFQKKFKLAVDGKVGPATWPKLVITVRKKDKGSAVSAVQHNLKFSYGFTSLAVDGAFGSKTEKAVKDFQKRFKLAVDGIVGLVTWNALIVHEK